MIKHLQLDIDLDGRYLHFSRRLIRVQSQAGITDGAKDRQPVALRLTFQKCPPR